MSTDPKPKKVKVQNIRPVQPNIDQSKRNLLSYWWTVPVAGTLGTFAYMGFYANRVTFGKKTAGEPEYLPKDRQEVANIKQLTGPFSSLDFTFGQTPCMLLELPAANLSSIVVQNRHFAAYSRLCTHQGCPVVNVQNTELLALNYNYRADHAMLGCPCHLSIFDPLSNGDSVFGQALYPLPRVQLEAKGSVLFAVGIEQDPRTNDNKG